MNGNRLTIFCNYDIAPFQTTTYVNGIPPDVLEKTFKLVTSYLPLAALEYEAAMGIVKDYYNLCFKPSAAMENLDPDEFIIQNLDITKYPLQPARLMGLSNLIIDAITSKLENKHVRVNINSSVFLSMVRRALGR